jgi:DNA-binding NarL/FixJ family response regulator
MARGVHPTRLKQRGQAYEAPASKRRIMIAGMREQGLSGRAIAGKLGISESEVRRLSRS